MKQYIFPFFIALSVSVLSSCGDDKGGITPPTPPTPPEPPTETRNVYEWPFASTSIWNMPIGSKAQYVHAGLEETPTMTIDEDYIVLMPDLPHIKIYKSTAGWDRSKSRCDHTGELLFTAPIPEDWEVSPSNWDGDTPNAGLAVLMEDGRTIKQTQPFAHCQPEKGATSMVVFKDESIYGDGIYGAHGGSGLSAIGGVLRIHELTPTSGPIRHALKINLWGAKNLYYDKETNGYRWPADRADGYAGEPNVGYGRQRSTPAVKDCRMGALLALHSSLDIESLELKTEPAKILAQALQDYGAYVVDDTYQNVNAFVTEWSPQGRFADIFEKNWGFKFTTNGKNDWGQDLIKIFAVLHIVTNNTENSVGGGGETRQPLAPQFE